MAGLVNITRKAETLQGFQLTTPDDMIAALKYILAGGYTGSVNVSKNGATAVWQLIIQNPATSVSSMASINDWLVIENSSVARVVPAASFANQYTP